MIKKYLLAAIASIFCFNVFAQDTTQVVEKPKPVANVDFDYAVPKKYVVEDILISGVQYLDVSQIEAITGIARGDTLTIPGPDLQFLMKKLWMQKYFSNVELKGLNVHDDKVTLEVFLQERPRVSYWDFSGVRKGEKEDLRGKLHLRRGGDLSDYVIATSIDVIKKHYAEKGYLNAEVSISQQPDTVLKNNYVRVTFNVTKNDKVKIKDINITGNDKVSAGKLRGAMKKTKQKRLSTILKSSKFNKENYAEDLDNLIAYYNEKGYRDAKVISDTVRTLNEKRVAIDINVFEGKRYYIRNIAWVGNSVMHEQQLNLILGLKKGDVYDKTALEKMLYQDDYSVQTQYQDLGYLFFQMNCVESNVIADSVDLEVRMYEGDQARFDRIEIAGNNRTNEHVIRRELLTKPGELFSMTQIRESVRRLAQSNYFDPEKLQTGIDVRPNPQEGTASITYNLVEKANDQLEISGGYGNGMFVGTLGVRFTNFSLRRMFEKGSWRPVPGGDGQTLSLRAQTNGSYYRAFSGTFVEPWLGGKKPTSLSVTGYHSTQTTATYFYQRSDQFMKVTGFDVGLGRRVKWPDYNFILSGGLSWQHYSLQDWQGQFIFTDGQSNNFSIRASFGRNTVDNPIFARGGSEFSIGVQLTPPYSLFNSDKDYKSMPDNEKYKWVEYHKWSLKGTVYTQLVGNLVLMTRAQLGYMGYYNKDIGYSPFEGYTLGGDGMSGYTLYGQENIGLRGYSNQSLTSRVVASNGSLIYASNSYVRYTAEIRYPVIMEPSSTIFVLAFLEGGNSWYDGRDFNPFAIKRSAGVGVRLLLPIVGMLGIDWGYGFDAVPSSPGAAGSNFHFVIGMPM